MWWFEFIVKYLGEAVLAEVVSSVMDMVPAVVAVVNPGAGEARRGRRISKRSWLGRLGCFRDWCSWNCWYRCHDDHGMGSQPCA